MEQVCHGVSNPGPTAKPAPQWTCNGQGGPRNRHQNSLNGLLPAVRGAKIAASGSEVSHL